MSFEWFTSCLGSRKLHQVDILGDYLRQYFTRVGKSIYRFPRSPSIITRGIAHGIRINYRLHLIAGTRALASAGSRCSPPWRCSARRPGSRRSPSWPCGQQHIGGHPGPPGWPSRRCPSSANTASWWVQTERLQMVTWDCRGNFKLRRLPKRLCLN